jgi:hypothetical protein
LENFAVQVNDVAELQQLIPRLQKEKEAERHFEQVSDAPETVFVICQQDSCNGHV